MRKIFYIHDDHKSIGIIFNSADTTAIYTGLEVLTEEDSPQLAEVESRCGLHFFRPGQPPDIPLYGVPELYVFATDAGGGYYVGTGLPSKNKPVYYIGPDYIPRFAAPSVNALLGGTNQKDIDSAESVPFQVFPSREAAEREFPIQDSWTVVRRSREPRFQVWPMESPADREGKAFVHYTSWIETYTGLIDPGILEHQSLEKCRAITEKHPENTFVLLDREQDDRVVGFACYSYRARDFISVPEASEICAFYILREYQGLGLGRLLMEHCLAWLPRPKVALLVLKGNERAIGFYEHMGFRLTGYERTDCIEGSEITELEMVMER